MKKEFIPYEQNLEIRNLGFDEPCFGWFTNSYLRIGSVVENKHVQGEDEILAPLYQQAFRWFREKHQLFSFITTIEDTDYKGFKFTFWIAGRNSDRLPVCDTYEEAELACLKKLIEVFKNK